MAAHGATRGLVREHAVPVVLNVWDVVERAQQRPGIKNRNHAVGAVGASVLYHTSFDGGDAPVLLNTGLKVNDGARPSAMRPEDFLAGIRDLHRSLGLARRHGSDDLERDHFALAAESSA